jgi:threonine dehydratase
MRLTFAQIQAAQSALRPYLPATPARRAGCRPEARLYLKLECWQPTGSFKVRGALSMLASLGSEAAARGLVTASAGNHALGVAFAAQARGGALPVTVFVPETAPRAKVEKLGRFPVTVVEAGRDFEGAREAAQEHQQRTGAIFIEPYDHPLVAAGQGTIGLELVEQVPDLEAVVVPVGGGGLITGIATAIKALAPAVRVIAVQPAASPALEASLAAGHALLSYPAGPTLADGLAGGIGELVWEHRSLIDEAVQVSEDEVQNAMAALLVHDQVVAEASGAVAVAAILSGRLPLGRGATAAVVTGGNLDAAVLRQIVERCG